jgi:membrane-associated phospholipid phosphatase
MNGPENNATRSAANIGSRFGDRRNSASRREFLARIPGTAAITLASTASPVASEALADAVDGSGTDRVRDAYEIREEAARSEARGPVPRQTTNRDEQKYPNFIGSFSKGLPHTSPFGEVNPAAYRGFLDALHRGTSAAFEKYVTLGGNTKLVNPLAGLAFDLEGTDSHQLTIPAFPSLASQALADLAVELYWMALCRDVNFTDYGTDPRAIAAAAELSTLGGFKGPRDNGYVTSQTLFRGFTADDVIGPYVSQLLLKPFDYGPYPLNGRMSVYVPGVDYLTDQASWLACRNGQGPFGPGNFGSNQVDPLPRCVRNGRDLATYVHEDPKGGLFMSVYNAGMFLFANGAPLNPGNPYRAAADGGYTKQAPFGTFGLPFFLGMIGEAASRAFKAAWYAKWFVHRALRPDEFGGLVHWTKTGQRTYPLDPDILNSDALTKIFQYNKALNNQKGLPDSGTYLLPQAYPEAGPQHPSYPSGHATMAGACATILKAAFDGSVPFSALANGQMTIAVASADGLTLSDYNGSDAGQITIEGEINKLASNIAQGRNFGGIHWRSDADYGMRLGEAVALSILSDQSDNYAGENFKGFTITTFDGKTITV